MRPYRPAAALLAVAALLPASGAEAATAAAGAATSTASLVSLSAVGHAVQVARLTASAGTTSGSLAKVVLQPLVLDGADSVPAITVEPSSSPKTVPSASTPGALGSILSVSSPALTLQATGGGSPASGVTTPSGLGSVSVLGMPVSLNGTVNVGSLVTNAKADASKAVSLENVALPSLADILDALGIDLAKLPVGVLNDLLAELPLIVSEAQATAKAAADTAIDTAQGAVSDAQTAVGGLQSDVTDATSDVTAAQTAANDAQAALDAALAAAEIDLADYIATPDALKATVYPAVHDAYGDDVTADGALDDAQTALDEAQDDLADAIATLNSALATLTDKIGDLAGIVEDVMSDAPLVSLASATVGTLARVDAAKTAQITGSVSGLKVLDLDLLEEVTGSSTVDLAGLASSVVDEVNGVLASVTTTLSDVLAGALGLSVPAPLVKVLDKATATGTDGAFGTADASVSVLSVKIPAIQLPETYALDSVLSALPANITQLTDSVLRATAFDLAVGTLGEQARFRPASLSPGAPNTPGSPGSLPSTGAPITLALTAAVVAAAGAVMARRTRAAEVTER